MSSTRFNDFVAEFDQELASEYAVMRPEYPGELFQWLQSAAPSNQMAWDAGTGTGELAVPLANRFGHVIASDMNRSLLGQARTKPNLEYRQWPSESPKLETNSVDLVTAGMSAHWFDGDQFYAQCRRVLRPGGIVAALGFYFFEVDDGIGRLVRDWYLERMTDYEYPELTILRRHYDSFEFPFPSIRRPAVDHASQLEFSTAGELFAAVDCGQACA